MTQLRRAAVFGGSGFVGRYVVRQLAEAGFSITVVGRHATKAVHLKPMGDVGQIQLRDIELHQETAIARSIEGADTVINLTGILVERGRQKFNEVHHEGPALIGRLAFEAGVQRLIHISAIGADPQSPSRYARSKALGEEAVEAVFPGATILRPSIVFGVEDEFFNRFALMARQLPFLPLIGGGRSRFQPVYVGDVAAAVLAALNRPGTIGKTYELGGPKVYTFKELMLLLFKEIGEKKPLSHVVDLPFSLGSFVASFAQFAPGKPLTPDQVTLLKHDNVVSDDALTLADLGIEATAVELILPSYLGRFRRGGWWSVAGRSAA